MRAGDTFVVVVAKNDDAPTRQGRPVNLANCLGSIWPADSNAVVYDLMGGIGRLFAFGEQNRRIG